MEFSDPICALSSPPGSGAIAMVRASGEGVIARCEEMVRLPGGRPLSSLAANETRYARFFRDDEPLDEVMVTCYQAPHSYTGEEMVEIACHGSPYIQQQAARVAQRAHEASPCPRRSISFVKVPQRYLHAVQFPDPLKPLPQARSQTFRWKGGQHTEVEIHGVTPVSKVKVPQSSAPFEAESLRQRRGLRKPIQDA